MYHLRIRCARGPVSRLNDGIFARVSLDSDMVYAASSPGLCLCLPCCGWGGLIIKQFALCPSPSVWTHSLLNHSIGRFSIFFFFFFLDVLNHKKSCKSSRQPEVKDEDFLCIIFNPQVHLLHILYLLTRGKIAIFSTPIYSCNWWLVSIAGIYDWWLRTCPGPVGVLIIHTSL